MNKQLFENLEALRRFINAKGSVYHEYAPALEAACNELAERATQPAQDLSTAQQENADFHQWWESSGQKAAHDLKTENAAHATWQERASRATALAQDQVAAVRAVPEGWKLTRCEDGAIIVSKNSIGGYAAWKDDSNIASSILYHFADELLTAAPSPQPELSEAPDTSQDWARLDGATAFHLIERHADGWSEVGHMMESWRSARQRDSRDITLEEVAELIEGQKVMILNPTEPHAEARAQATKDCCKSLAAQIRKMKG